MPKVIFKKQPGSIPELFPENIFDKIPSDHPVRLVDTVVDGLDISGLLKQYKGGGTSAYHPGMMVKVLFCSYLSNVYSCRKSPKHFRRTSILCLYPATVPLISGRSMILEESV